MKERIHKSVISLIIAVVLESMLANCVYYKLATPVQPESQVLEAPLNLTPVQIAFWRAVKYWFLSGGGTGKSPIGKPENPSG